MNGLLAGIAETAEIDPLGEYWSCALAFFPTITGHVCRGFMWRNNEMTKLPTLGGINGFAAGSNNSGQVVGWAETNIHDKSCIPPQVLQFEAVIYGPAPQQIKALSPLSPDPDSAATAINNKGQAVGISGDCSNAVGGFSAKHAVLWQPDGSVVYIPGFGGKGWNTPMAINNKTEVVGFADLSGDDVNGQLTLNAHAFFWTPELGRMVDLGTLSGDVIGWANGINNSEEVVGRSCVDNTFAVCTGVLWQNHKIIDLNSIIPHDASVYIVDADDINDYGEIAGTACAVSNNVCNGTLYSFLAVSAVPLKTLLSTDGPTSSVQSGANRPEFRKVGSSANFETLGRTSPQSRSIKGTTDTDLRP